MGIDKENEFLKYLKINHKAHKYEKVRFFIRVDMLNSVSATDFASISLLCNMIKTQKLTRTVLILSQELYNLLVMQGKLTHIRIPSYTMNSEDLSIIATNAGKSFDQNNPNIDKNLYIVKNLGIAFYLNNYKFFDDTAEEVFSSNLEITGYILSLMKAEKHIVRDVEIPLDQLLEFSSLFSSTFSSSSIANFEDNYMKAKYLKTATELSIIRECKPCCATMSEYIFFKEIFRKFYYNSYCINLAPSPRKIYEYFRLQLPFLYMSMLYIVSIDPSMVNKQDIASLLVMQFFCNFQYCTISDEVFNNFLVNYPYVHNIIILYEAFKQKQKLENAEKIAYQLIQDITKDSFDIIATCASLSLLLQVVKENFLSFPSLSFRKILFTYKSYIVRISVDNLYGLYWQLYFKSLYIAFSLEDEETTLNTASRFIKEIFEAKYDIAIANYIETNKLLTFKKVELLAYSLGLADAENILRNLFNEAEESSIRKELARINLSACLIEKSKYIEASCLLPSGREEFLRNINLDTENAYLNNRYLAMYLSRKISLLEFIRHLECIMQNDGTADFNDDLIIRNNLYTAYLGIDDYRAKGIQCLEEIVQIGNPYNCFYAMHNLLSAFYSLGEQEKFSHLYPTVRIPKLLRSSTTFFDNKFRLMAEGKEWSEIKDELDGATHVPPIYKELLIYGTVERWFEQ